MPPAPLCAPAEGGDKTLHFTYPGYGDHNHGGGIQVMGDYVIIPFTAKQTGEHVARVKIANISNPRGAIWGESLLRFTRSHRTGCSVGDGDRYCSGAASMTKLAGGRYLVMAWGYSAKEADLWLSREPNLLSLESEDWVPVTTHVPSSPDWASYQNIQLVTQCDGTMFLVGTRGGDGGHYADLFEFRLEHDPATGRYSAVTSDKLNSATPFVCDTDDTGYSSVYCDFAAGAGVYVDPQGKLHMYAVERFADVRGRDNDLPGGAWIVGFREFAAP
jgi:hypothetical protein